MDKKKDGKDNPHCSSCGFDQLKALYRVNTLAKKYGDSAAESYESGMKRRARIHSQRKKALYNIKRDVLGKFVENGCVDNIRTHEIEGRTYYCVYVGEFSFHTPISEWEEPPQNAPENSVKLESFDRNSNNHPEDFTERNALTQFTEYFESPNKYIESPFTDDNYGATFVGWSYLPDALEEGDRVPNNQLYDHNGDGDFIFDIGDTFQTGKGDCEIIDRYHAYLTPLYDRSPLVQRPAYTVRLDGKLKESIRQRCIVDDWWVLADSIEDPVPNVNGKLSDMAGGAIERLVEEPIKFEIGDIIELKPMKSGEQPTYCRLTELHVSGPILIGQYDPVQPSNEAPLGLTVEEIADDVVAVHDTPPKQG